MNSKIYSQLSVMMFLQFFMWGTWFVTMGTFLGSDLKADGDSIGVAYMTQAWGAIVAPFIMGLIADRFFSAQKLLGVLHIVGAGLLYMAGSSGNFAQFYPYILTYMIIYMPTLALVNSVAFCQMDDPSKQFARVRIWGTIGWIAAGMLIGYVFQWEAKNMLGSTFILGAIASGTMGIYSFFLPNTPPPSKGQKTSVSDILGLESLGLLKDRNYLIFFVSSVLICIPLAFYYSFANPFLNEVGMRNAAGNMTFGQISEVLFMLLLPIFLRRYGLKMTLAVGMFAWALRYVLFAFGDAGSSVWMLFLGIILHGICYDFFFVSGQIFTDHKADEKIRSAAQGLITLATYGVGMLIGFKVAGLIVDNYVIPGGHDWETIWTIPAGFAALVLLLFMLTFKTNKSRMPNKIKLGILGGGGDSLIGILHRVAASMRDNYEIVGGVFNPIWEENIGFAKEIGLPTNRIYKDFDTMVEEELKLPENERMEVVSVLTPNFLHFPMANKLLASGFNVICEKPMTMTYEEAKIMNQTLADQELVFAVTYTYTGYPMIREMKERIASGEIGEVQKIDAQYYQGWINPIIHDKDKRKNTWRLDPKKSGISCCIGDIGTHAFDMIEFVTGSHVKEVLADLNYIYEDNVMDIDGTVLIRMSETVKGVLRASQIATGEENNFSVAVYGRRGGFKWEQENPNYLIYLPEEGAMQILKRGHVYNSKLSLDGTKIPPGHPEGIFDSMGNIYHGVAKAIRKESYHLGEFPTITDGTRGMDFIEKVVESHKKGNVWVQLDN